MEQSLCSARREMSVLGGEADFTLASRTRMTPLADMEADMEISSVASNRGMNADDLNERHTIGSLLKAAVNFSSCTHATRAAGPLPKRCPKGYCPKSALYFPSSSLALAKTAMGSVSTWAEIRRPPHSVDGKLGRRRRWIPRRTPSKLIHTMLVRDYPRKG